MSQGRFVLIGFFFFAPTSHRIINMQLANPNRVATVCLIIFGAHMTILFITKMKILVLITWSYSAPPPNG